MAYFKNLTGRNRRLPATLRLPVL